jgi:tRNA threonylcarbamoyladenosine biosynthesis protein TsaE
MYMTNTTLGPIYLADEAATNTFGAQMSCALTASAAVTVYLSGELGAGKTALVRAFLRARGYCGAVPSPTYTLVEIYDVGDVPVQHFDLYRLSDPEELEFIGARDYFSDPAIRFVEWHERGRGVLPTPDVQIDLKVEGAGRSIALAPMSDSGRQLVKKLSVPDSTLITG